MSGESKYTIEVFDPDDNRVADVTGLWTEIEFSARRNRAERVRLVADLGTIEQYARDAKIALTGIFIENRNWIRISRNGTPLLTAQINYTLPRAATEEQTYRVEAVGVLDLFRNRYLTSALSYTATDAGQIAWGAITQTQNETNGSLGVTQGNIETTIARNRNYPQDKNIRDLLIELSEVIGGFDFNFTWDKKFNIFEKQGGKKNGLVFQYPGNILEITQPRDGTQMINQVLGRGNGNGEVQFNTTRNDLGSQGKYTLRQHIMDRPDISELETLEEHADEMNRIFSQPVKVPSILLDGNQKPALGKYWIGDTINVIAPNYQSFSNMKNVRIDEIQVNIDVDGVEVIRLVVN